MKKILFILLSLFWAVYVQAASLSVDIHTPNPSKPCQFAKVYFLPDWNDKDFAFADQDEMPCTEVCPQKTDYDCKYGTESYVNGCGLTCSRCLECYGCEGQGYTLNECPVNGICLNDCCNKLYKLESCKSGYIKENNGCRAETCSENASLCDNTAEKCVNGKCVEKDCTEYPGKCGNNQVCIDGECIAKDCNNTPSLCTATEKCQLQNGIYKCVCSPTCTNETNCPNGYDTPVANGCGGTCSVCRTTPAEAIIFTFSPDTTNVTLTLPTAAYSGVSANYNVDWGDGSTDKNLTAFNPKHTYAKAGNYDVTITGSLGKLGQISYANIKYVTALKQLNLGSIKAFNDTFYNGKNITGSIPQLPNALIDGSGMFYGCSGLTGNIPVLPTTLKVVGTVNTIDDDIYTYGMFQGCKGLTGNIPQLPSGLTSGDAMFASCSGLTGNIPQLPSGLTSGNGMFSNCYNLTGSIPELPSGLTDGNGMFALCDGLTGNIPQLPSGLTSGDAMFASCSGLTGNIPQLPNGLIDGSEMFRSCHGLTGNIPAFPTTLQQASGMFAHCGGLTGSIPQLPDSLKNGGTIQRGQIGMFSDCYNLTGNIPQLPSGLTSGDNMFSNCHNLTGSIPELPKELTSANSMFSGCSGLTGNIPELPAGLTNGSYMFNRCSGLTGNIPELPNSLIWGNFMFTDSRGLNGVTPVNGRYPYQYLSNIKYYDAMVARTSYAIEQHFPTSWGGSCTSCQ